MNKNACKLTHELACKVIISVICWKLETLFTMPFNISLMFLFHYRKKKMETNFINHYLYYIINDTVTENTDKNNSNKNYLESHIWIKHQQQMSKHLQFSKFLCCTDRFPILNVGNLKASINYVGHLALNVDHQLCETKKCVWKKPNSTLTIKWIPWMSQSSESTFSGGVISYWKTFRFWLY